MICNTRFASQNQHQARRGFTLVELLVVVGVIALLVSLVMAITWSLKPRARQLLCKSNLRQLGQLFHVDSRSLGNDNSVGVRMEGVMMTSSRWVNFMYRQGDPSMNKLLKCPDGGKVDPVSMLDRIWIRQVGNSGSANTGEFHTSLGVLIRTDWTPDWQVSCYYQGSVHGTDATADDFIGVNGGKALEDNEIIVFIATCATVKIVINEEEQTFDVIPMNGRNVGMSGSNHWVLYGDGDVDTWQDDVVVRLTGVGNKTVYPPQEVGMLPYDYGMNNLVNARVFRYEQLWMTEYNSDIIGAKTYDRDDPFDGVLDNGELQARHMGKANYLTVSGAVFDATPEELETHFEAIDGDGDSLFDH